MENFTILIVHEDPNRRARLREMLGQIAVKGTIKAAATPRDAVKALGELTGVDCVFLSSAIELEDLDSLIATSVRIQPLKRPHFILTLRAAQQSHDIVANFAIRGADAFLQEPFSSGEISKTLEAIQRIQENPAAEEKKLLTAAQFVYQSMARLLDTVSIQLIQEKPGGYSLRDLRRLGPITKDLHSKVGDKMLEAMFEPFMNAECTDTSKFRKVQKRKKVQHPGITLKNLMDRRGLTPARIAASLSTEEATIVKLLECAEAINEEMAKGLAHLLGETPKYWLGLQQEYDKHKLNDHMSE